ncbi:MAG: GFA family protein [Pseudomonadota bacterium]
MAELAGRCLCGAVRWESAAPALWMMHCHCESCRRQCGAGVVGWIGAPAEAFRWIGEAPRAFESSPGATRRFCGACGTPVSFEHARWPGEVHVYAAQLTVGTFRPTAHVHWAERVDWLELADGLPRHEGLHAGG